MSGQASFTLLAHNPDVLSCIANLSNDEVFTPPELANQMLDTLAEAWAEAHGGASIWADPTVTFLDPFTKSGVFLREIVARLIIGLADQLPGLQQRVDHVLSKQVFGIGITQLTALLARRSVYCSKYANGAHSVATSFDNEDGNIWFERTEHSWEKRKKVQRVHPTSGVTEMVEQIGSGRCRFCSAQEQAFGRESALESHAYAFIHTDDIKARVAELFGADMQFDVIIGNPPYQLAGAAGGTSDASIYQLFVEQSQRLEPRFLSMVTPSRWLAGGRGLDEFRQRMLGGGKLQVLVDYPVSDEVFPGVEIKGGVSYFLWGSSHAGECVVSIVRGGETQTELRSLGEFDVFVRDAQAVSILKKVLALGESSITGMLSRDTPFGFASNFEGFGNDAESGDVPIYVIKRMKRSIGFVDRNKVTKNTSMIDSWKVLVPEAYNGGDKVPHQIVGRPEIAPNPSVCTQSYLFLECESEDIARSVLSYYRTRFFRFLISLRKITQHAIHSTYNWVPIQTWDREWTDEALYEKYGITEDEIEFIESKIRPMEAADA